MGSRIPWVIIRLINFLGLWLPQVNYSTRELINLATDKVYLTKLIASYEAN